MNSAPKGLSTKAVAVLEMIAEGHTYDRVLAAYPDMSYLDIFAAAQRRSRTPARPAGTTRKNWRRSGRSIQELTTNGVMTRTRILHRFTEPVGQRRRSQSSCNDNQVQYEVG